MFGPLFVFEPVTCIPDDSPVVDEHMAVRCAARLPITGSGVHRRASAARRSMNPLVERGLAEAVSAQLFYRLNVIRVVVT